MNKLLKSSWERMPSNQALFIKSFVQVFTVIGAIQLGMNVISHDFLIAEFDKVAIFSVIFSMVLVREKQKRVRN
ncbi:hypothetical protein AB3K25_09790 [Leuconostoc sp. MS02]|uniref:Holin n=1 Tax=Leuconostoc aquikimchii TaxID=3236804 RepID=A0ABV3S057_9LACO